MSSPPGQFAKSGRDSYYSIMAIVVIVAAGQGRRLGGGVPKQFLELGGIPIWLRAVRPFMESDQIGGVVVVAPKAWVASVENKISSAGFRKPARVVAGGKERRDSVREGLGTVRSLSRAWSRTGGYLEDPDDPIVLIHDGARPLVTQALVRKIIQAAQKHGAAVPGLVPRDTLKLVGGRGGVVRETLDRSRLREIQTPQGFRFSLIQEAYRAASRDNFTATDDAALVERIGYPVRVVSGDPRNVKITSRVDLKIVEVLLVNQAKRG